VAKRETRRGQKGDSPGSGPPAHAARGLRCRTLLAVSRAVWLPAAVGALAGVFVFVLARDVLIDDSYITLAYARTFAEHGVWGMQPQLPGNAATSPLNVLLLALFIVPTGQPVLAAGVLLVLALAVTGAALGGICAHLDGSHWPAAVGVALVAVNPLLVSVIGMETHLAIALVAVLAWTVLARRPYLAGVACGLLLLTRADLAGFGLAAAVAIVVTVDFRRVLAFIGITGLVSLPWSVLSWFWLGSAVPDTMVIKLGESMGDRTFANGLYYFFEAYPFAVAASLIPPAVGVLVLLGGWKRGAVSLQLVLGVGGLLHAGTYLLLNTAPYQWYYGPAIGALTMLGAVGAPRASLRTVALGASVATVALTAGYLVARPWTLTTISGNWATPTEYRELAERAPAGAVVQSFGEVGTVAYYCTCTVTDRLSDRGWFAEILAEQQAKAGPFERTLLELNYRNFHAAPRLTPQFEFTFTPDRNGVPATSWRGDQGTMVVAPFR
jgi:hypothetical protein